MTKSIFFLLPFLFCFCKNTNEQPAQTVPEVSKHAAKSEPTPANHGKTIADRFSTPSGFSRIKTKPGSFAHFLQNLPLKPAEAEVLLFDGSKKRRQDVHAAVVDLDVGKRDLQQCADAIMRLRAEYLLGEKKYEDIHFNFVNGFRAEYSKWRNGNRIKVEGNRVKWVTTQRESKSYESFRKYMDMVFSYAGTLSLAKELNPVPLSEMKIGDVFIQGGSPGHAILVVDMCEQKERGKKRFLLAQSYMPAQDIHVLKNPDGGVWYDLDLVEELKTPEWIFSKNDLKRFE